MEAPVPLAQGLPFVQRQTQFAQPKYEELKQQASQPSNQHSIISQTLGPPPPQAEALQSDQGRPVHEKEEIQLLYVPLETLRQREQRQRFQQDHATAQSQVRFIDQQNLAPQAHKQVQLKNIEQEFIQQALQAQKLQQQFQQQPYPQQLYQPFDVSQFPHQQTLILEASTRVPTTTVAPVKKRKPHQPPLAVYMGTDGHDISVGDVLELLKNEKTITVQDYISDDSPKVFVGPSNLQAPEGYIKFSLPYLSSFDKHTRVQGLHKVPFFVAPLNYKTPPGYSKIPFPSPHVGSVVINHRNEDVEEKEKLHPNLLSDQQLNDKDSQLLYNEASTVASHNKNRQAFSTVFPVPSDEPNVPYGPLPIRQNQQSYSTPRTLVSTQVPILSTTPRAYLSTPEPQAVTVSPNVYVDNFSKSHRFTTGTPTTIPPPTAPSSTESVSHHTQIYSVTPNRNRGSANRPQVSLATPDDAYYDTTRNRSPNRYLPEIKQPPVTTTKQYLIEQVTPKQQLSTHILNENFNTPKYEETYLASPPTKLSGFETARVNISINNSQRDQEYKPSYQNENLPNQYEIRPDVTKQKVEENPRVVTESSYFNANLQTGGQQLLQNQQYHLPQVTPQQVLQDVREKERNTFNRNQQYVLTLSPQSDGYIQLPQPVEVTHRFVFKQEKASEQPTFVTTERQTQQYVSSVPPAQQQQQYKLPADLPISPQLPSLVNSLEDQAIRPLLAPLLLPTADEAEQTYIEHTSQKLVTTTAVPELPVSTEVEVTREPPVETTTPYRRLRGRHRGTRPPSYSTTRTRTSSNVQRRKPYQEINKESEASESTTRSSLLRNRYSGQRERQQVSAATETTREPSVTYQKRFRTRGRPVKLEEEFNAFTGKTTTSTEKVVEIPPSTQYSVQALPGNIQITPISLESSTEDERKSYITALNNEQPLAYLINGQHLINQNIQTGEEQPTIYILKEETPVLSESKEEKIEKSKETEHVQTNVRTPQPIDQSQFLVETTKPRTRSRTRDRTRSRGHSHSTTTTTTTPSTTKESKETEEESGEFYGFFRKPEFKPLRMEYKPSSELRSTGAPVQQSTFYPQYTSDDQSAYFVSEVRPSTPRVYQIQTVEIPSEEDRTQYINSRLATSVESNEEIKPVTIRTTPSRRRYTTPQQSTVQEVATNSPERYFTSRPKSRSETQAQPQRTRIRGRIRRPTTAKPEKESTSSSEENYSTRSQSHSTTPKLRSRGKVHFRLPKDEDKSADEDISENYPPSFLKSQERTPRPVFKLTVEPDSLEEQEGAYSTHPRSRNKDLVKGEESQRYEKTVEGPNGIESEDFTREKGSKLDVVKISETTEINEYTSPVSAKLVDDSSENSSDYALEDTADDNQSTTETSSESFELDVKTEEATTVSSTTLTTSTEHIPIVTRKKGRRGVWRLVGHRPIDMFQSAESQNVGAILANDLFEDEKNYKIDKNKVAQMLTERPIEFSDEPINDDKLNLFDIISFTTENPITTPEMNETDVSSTLPNTTENVEKDETEEVNNAAENITQEPNEKEIEEAEKVMSFFEKFVSSLDKYSTTTEKPKKSDKSDFWKSRIIGTSTTTEVSHETEICYKGRCIKSQN